jgi:hypothetical protein
MLVCMQHYLEIYIKKIIFSQCRCFSSQNIYDGSVFSSPAVKPLVFFSKEILKNFLSLAAERFFSENKPPNNSRSLEERRRLSSEDNLLIIYP